MITKLTIENFKSIKSLTMDCKRVNVFIGEPNSGKTNILEALGFLSWCGHMNSPLAEYVRLQYTQNLFYDEVWENPVHIRAEGTLPVGVKIRFENDSFQLRADGIANDFARIEHTGQNLATGSLPAGASGIRFYAFKEQGQFPGTAGDYLTPPHGNNLFSLIYGRQRFRELMRDFFTPFGLTAVMKPQEKRFEVQKQANDVAVNHPYEVLSDTVKRTIFHTAAMASNNDATLVFDEPESNAFPYFIKELGERIARDEENQYFIATHNPYLLNAIAEKGKRGDINVAITFFRDYKTQVKCLTPDQLEELLDADPFFNLRAFVEEDTPA